MKSKILIGFLASASLFATGLFMNHSVSATPPSSPIVSHCPSYDMCDSSFHCLNYHISGTLITDEKSLFINIEREHRFINHDNYLFYQAIQYLLEIRNTERDLDIHNVFISYSSPIESENSNTEIAYRKFQGSVDDLLSILQ